MNLSSKILSDITVYMKYARYLNGRRESWDEIVDRNKEMHIHKFPNLKDEIESAYKYVYDKKVLPSMRSMQFAGRPIEISPNRIFNCSYLPIDDWRAFSEIMFLLLGGTGVGYSVQYHHIDKLPEIKKPNQNRKRRFLIGDSIEGWADSIKVLMKSYFFGGPTIDFDFSDIRQKGSLLVTSGGKAPGPQPLKECIVKLQGILDSKLDGDKLTTLEVHDLICHIADAVLAGGIRRAALISLFSANDMDMLTSKSGNWWELNPQRGRANNSVVLLRHRVTKEYFNNIWDRIKLSGSGEPGIYFTNDKDWGTNPCCVVGDTEIETENGIMKIYDIITDLQTTGKVPKIWTYNEETKQKELDTIEFGDMTRENAEIINIELDNGRNLKLTPDHQVYTKNRGWVEAHNLTEDDELLNFNTILLKIKNITKEKNEDVFDIQMSNNHNFYANGILIHNCEIALRPYQFCNLCEVNVSDIQDQNDFNERVRAAAFIGTLQASYTDFHYLRDVWKKTTEKEALIGISMTGIASGEVLKMDMDLAASIIKNENKRVAEIIGIKPAARTTAVKPAGTTSLTLGTSSGIHAWHNDFYIRRLRINKSESIYNYLINQVPELMEDDFLRPHDTSIISIPQMAPKGSILRTESALSLLNRIKFIHDKWIKPGHISGQNTHNVSATVSIKDDEWDSVGEWMWLNKDSYNGLSVMPYSDHTYKQTPYEDISEDEYYDLYKRLKTIDLYQVYESDDMTNLSGEIACSGGACEII